MPSDVPTVDISSAAQRVQSISCTIHSRVVESGGGPRSRERTRRCYALADGRYREERASSITVFDGTVLWVVPKDGGVVTRSDKPLPPLDRMLDPRWLLEEHRLAFIRSVQFDGRSAVEAGAQFTRASGTEAEVPEAPQYSLIIDVEYGILLSMRDESSGMEVELADVRLNEELDEALFEYLPETGRGVQSADAGPVSGVRLFGALGAAARKRFPGGRR